MNTHHPPKINYWRNKMRSSLRVVVYGLLFVFMNAISSFFFIFYLFFDLKIDLFLFLMIDDDNVQYMYACFKLYSSRRGIIFYHIVTYIYLQQIVCLCFCFSLQYYLLLFLMLSWLMCGLFIIDIVIIFVFDILFALLFFVTLLLLGFAASFKIMVFAASFINLY